jgi:hypothetical protein
VQGKQPTNRYGKTAHSSPPPSRSESSSPSYSAREPNFLTPIIEDGNEEIRLQPPEGSLLRSLNVNNKNFR